MGRTTHEFATAEPPGIAIVDLKFLFGRDDSGPRQSARARSLGAVGFSGRWSNALANEQSKRREFERDLPQARLEPSIARHQSCLAPFQSSHPAIP
jgi:hypothetical protein